MQGGHDLGGKQGLGLINPEPEPIEPVFHYDWERRVFALTLATGMLGEWNIDQSRFARERQHPAAYLNNSYYENWYEGTCRLLLENKLISKNELESGRAEGAVSLSLRVPSKKDAIKILSSGGPTRMDVGTQPKFNIGDSVYVRKKFTDGHTRVPAYVQGCIGEIVMHHGGHVFPDTNVTGNRKGEHLYSVRFGEDSLWGSNEDKNELYIDLWEPYLELK
ncbi:MAG: nitrile hydratase subunit beta [Gammaproteobacteria bacterium]|nr:nitrile hydratase subunit beta [Gammaproteobacteria bacterium]|tara:strand:+ start:965 stop:1624 length:660 start_codon:yes stop_codon:yes gene_type:complete